MFTAILTGLLMVGGFVSMMFVQGSGFAAGRLDQAAKVSEAAKSRSDKLNTVGVVFIFLAFVLTIAAGHMLGAR